MHASHLLLGAVGAWLILVQINERLGSPSLAIVGRWMRWLFFAFGGGWICVHYHWVDRPFWAVALGLFLAWFLVETLYNWLAISALSSSSLPLFPRYELNPNGGEWPMSPRILKMRDWLRQNGFTPVQAVKASVGSGLVLRLSIYQDAGAKTRVQVIFLPQPGGSVSACASFESRMGDGRRFITDNLSVPFAGFYPEEWFVERRPRCRSLKRLAARHRRRLEKAGAALEALGNEPVQELNQAQRDMERVNTELGFLHPTEHREDYGKISPEGRFRVWKEIWMLNYLGRTVRYD